MSRNLCPSVYVYRAGSPSASRKAPTPVLVGLCALLALCGQAQAGPIAPDDGCLKDSVCNRHYTQALKLFEEGHFESALPQFQAAYQRRQMPWLLINIGRTLHRLGRSQEALQHYERFQHAELNPSAETRERLQQYIEQARTLSDSAATPTPPPPREPTTAEPKPPKEPLSQSPTPPPEPGVAVSIATPPRGSTEPPRPLYRKWWFWTAVGGGVVLIGAVAIGATAAALANHPAGLPGNITKVSFSF